MKSGFEELVWIRDRQDQLFACYADDIGEHNLELEAVFYGEEFSRCIHVNRITDSVHRFHI